MPAVPEEQHALLQALQAQLQEAGAHGLTPQLQATLARLRCANEHEALLMLLDMVLGKREKATAASRANSEIAYSSLY